MIDICDFAVGLSRQLYGLTIASERPNHRMIEQWHPLGPVLVISAFNFPGRGLGLECRAGAGLRRSGDLEAERENAALRRSASWLLVRRALGRFGDAPDGLIQLVQGEREIGEALVDDPRIALVSATGSTAMGRAVGPRVAQRFGRVLLELGGNNAMIVCAKRGPRACRAGNPVLGGRNGRTALHDPAAADRPRERRRRAGRARSARLFAQVNVGDPREPDTLVGPLIDEAAYRGDAQGAWRPKIERVEAVAGRSLRPAGDRRTDRAGRNSPPRDLCADPLRSSLSRPG